MNFEIDIFDSKVEEYASLVKSIGGKLSELVNFGFSKIVPSLNPSEYSLPHFYLDSEKKIIVKRPYLCRNWKTGKIEIPVRAIKTKMLKIPLNKSDYKKEGYDERSDYLNLENVLIQPFADTSRGYESCQELMSILKGGCDSIVDMAPRNCAHYMGEPVIIDW